MDSSSSGYVVGIGECLIDRINGKDFLGGAPVIFTYHAARSGNLGIVISGRGNDKEGDYLEKELRKKRLDSRLAIIPDSHSGVVEVDASDPHNPQYNIDMNAAWTKFPLPENYESIAAKAKAVYFGPLASYCGDISKTSVDRFLAKVSQDCFIIFDVNLRYNPDDKGNYTKHLFDFDIIEGYIKKCNVLKVNIDELNYLSDKLKIEGGEMHKCRMILALYPNVNMLIVTMGGDGSTVYWRGNDNRISFSSLGMPVEVNNRSGAGDALAGALIGTILKRKDKDIWKDKGKLYVSAHHAAVRRSALVCEEGNSMPRVEEYDLFISYSRKDEKVIDNYFLKKFQDSGLSIWLDRDKVSTGDEFTPEIEQGIIDSSVVVYFSSRAANRSKYVTAELQSALDNGKPVIPIKLDGTPYSKAVRSRLEVLDFMDCTLSKLMDDIKKQMDY